MKSSKVRIGGLVSALAIGLATLGLATLGWAATALAAPPVDPIGSAAELAGGFGSLEELAAPASGAQTALRVLIMMTLLSLLPALVLTMTCFTRIMIVFTFLRQALGVQGMPPTQVLTGLALFLTAFIMAPVAERMYADAIEPLGRGAITATEAFERGQEPLATFMLEHCSDDDLRLFYEISGHARPQSRKDVDFVVLAPAFILGEIRTGFQMGFLVMVPFLVIDLVVSSILMAMGMMMLPPALVALPVKVMVFVLVDGWGLIVGSLARSFT